jgi:hypothetical protein
MRRSPAPSSSPGTFFAAQFSAGYTTNMSGFDLRQTQQPVAFSGPAAQPSNPAPAPSDSSAPASAPKANAPEKAAAPDTKRRVEAGLTAAAIAAIIVQATPLNTAQAGLRPSR